MCSQTAQFLFAAFIGLGGALQASAQNVHLSLCIDGSGSISGADFDLQVAGTAEAIQDVVPIDGTVELSAIVFASGVTPIDLNGAAAGNSLIIDSQADKDSAESIIASVSQPGGVTNIQGCISQAMDQMGCGAAVQGGNPVDTCPAGVTQLIDISTDGDPTANNYPADGSDVGASECDTSAGGILECNEDTNDAANQASTAGVDVINVIGVGTGPSVNNMITWVYAEGNLPYDINTGAGHQPQVFDPDDIYNENSATEGLGNPPLPVSLLGNYANSLPILGDRGYVVLVGDFDQYEPTINAKIFNELNIESNISVTKTANVNPVAPGGMLVYTLNVENIGLEDVPTVTVQDTLPPGVTLVSAAGPGFTCTAPPATIIDCTIDPLPAGADIDITVTVTVDP